MTTIEAIIERAKDGTYTVYCVNEIFSGAGETIERAQNDMQRQMDFYKETAKAEQNKRSDHVRINDTVNVKMEYLRHHIEKEKVDRKSNCGTYKSLAPLIDRKHRLNKLNRHRI